MMTDWTFAAAWSVRADDVQLESDLLALRALTGMSEADVPALRSQILTIAARSTKSAHGVVSRWRWRSNAEAQ